MKELIEKINKLIENGDSFTWENSSKRESHGVYGNKPSGVWNAWVSRIGRVLNESVREGSEPFIYFKTGKSARIEGNYRDEFPLFDIFRSVCRI